MAVVAVAFGLAACAPGPAPKPTPTPLFASEAEAFKAAEQVYRAYVDAANARRSNPSTDAESFLVGKALEEDIGIQRTLKERNVHVAGKNVLTNFRGTRFNRGLGSVDAELCLDVSESRVIAEDGTDVTPAERISLVSMQVRMVQIGATLKISESNPGEFTCVAP
jgi:hypothetical protein